MNRFSALISSGRLALIVSLPENSAALARACQEHGADAIRVHANVTHAVTGRRFGTIDAERDALISIRSAVSCALGIFPGLDCDTVSSCHEEAEKLGFDYLDGPAFSVAAAVLCNQRRSSLWMNLSIDSVPFTPIRPMPDCSIIASVIHADGYGRPLSVGDLAMYRSVVESCGNPVIVPTDRLITPRDIEALHLIGVRGLMIGPVVTGTDTFSIVDAVDTFRRAIDDVA